MNGSELFAEFRQTGSETAFAEIVRHFTNLVYSVAQRRLESSALAEEATQIVFTRLARSAPRINTEFGLVGWLHRTALHVSIDLWRAETRRRNREANAMDFSTAEPNIFWTSIAPHLDSALDQLTDSERQILLLRFFERKRFAEVAGELLISEEAARMRVSRAIEKLRQLLAPHVTSASISTALLGTVLIERTVEAAPASVLESTLSLRPGAHLHRLRLGPRPTISKTQFALGTFAVICVGLLVINKQFSRQSESAANAQKHPGENSGTRMVGGSSAPLQAPRGQADAAGRPLPPTTRTVLALVDSTGAPIPNARVHMAYFYDGGVGEGHKMASDQNGLVAIPFPKKPGHPGANLFVTAKGFVPKVTSFDEPFPDEYKMQLDPAVTLSGQVMDETGRPVPSVAVTLNGEGRNEYDREHVAFNSPETVSTTDLQGRFELPYATTCWKELRLVLTADGYAVTTADLQAASDPARLSVTIRRGVTITGRVTDEAGLPMAGAEVKELHSYGTRRLATFTDADGGFALCGLSNPIETSVNLVVRADAMAPLVKAVSIVQPTNTIEIVLARATLFQGRAIDEKGLPIAEVTVRTDSDNNGIRKFEWLDYTKPDGSFHWSSAPREELLFWFEKEGYQTVRGLPLTPNGSEYEITLLPIGSPIQLASPVKGGTPRPKITDRLPMPPRDLTNWASERK